ncbi:MAG: DegT/DnrJ/EryC1/StrS family aminotransferase [Parachlamydiaceae bacterium]|nr:DegT/DnrJ/EryC1/StrS family aminotransferase [Parachlamydiaceae bacterium]
MEFVALKQQYALYKTEIDSAIQEVLDQGCFIMGPHIKKLERVLAEYVGTAHCIAVSSGTDSLQIALMALGIGPGDEVITVSFTWISSTEVIGLVGATPVFVDIDHTTYNIDISQIEQAITSKTKAILAVNLFGQMPDYRAINSIAEKYGLAVIEDGAQSFGATQHGQKSGSVSTVGSTSFFPAKSLGCYGDGGALFTNDEVLAAKMRAIRTHGGEQRHHHPYLGMNGRMDTLQAAILLAKFPHFPEEIAARQRLGAFYTDQLKDYCITPAIESGNTHVYAPYTIRIPQRDQLAQALKAEGIPTAVYYPKCVHEQPVFHYLNYARGSLPVAEQAADEVLSLPMHPWLTNAEQEQVVTAIKKFMTPLGTSNIRT